MDLNVSLTLVGLGALILISGLQDFFLCVANFNANNLEYLKMFRKNILLIKYKNDNNIYF